MDNVLANIKENISEFHKVIMKNIEEYAYRAKRYDSKFSIMLFCKRENIDIDFEKLEDKLRKTDKLIRLNDDLWCIVLDSTTDKTYTKATENIALLLQKLYYGKNLFIASQEFDSNYLGMLNELFYKLEYAVTNDVYDTVIEQDYII